MQAVACLQNVTSPLKTMEKENNSGDNGDVLFGNSVTQKLSD